MINRWSNPEIRQKMIASRHTLITQAKKVNKNLEKIIKVLGINPKAKLEQLLLHPLELAS